MERRLPQATESQRRLPAYPPDKLLQLVLTAKRIFLVKNGYYSKKIIIIICLLARLKKIHPLSVVSCGVIERGKTRSLILLLGKQDI